MANIFPQGIDDSTGQNVTLNQGVDLLILGTNDFSSASYTGGDISIGTSNDGAYADVDANNAKITFTVNLVGKYRVEVNFSTSVAGSLGVSLNSVTSFRLTDGTNNSDSKAIGALLPGITLFISGITHQVKLSHVFTFNSTGNKTIKLQKKNTTSSSVNTRTVLAGSDSAITISVLRIAD